MSNTVRVATANLNLPPKSVLTWSTNQYEDFINDTGYDGLELHPARGRLTLECMMGRTSMVTSLHQSFRSEKLPGTFGRLRTAEKPVRALARELAIVATLPHLEHSIAYLEKVQAHKDQKLPIVLYPTDEANYSNLRGKFGPQLWQPTADVLHGWNVLSDDADIAMKGMVRVMDQKGFDGVCIDTFHWPAERDGLHMPAWQESLPLLARDGHIHEVHFGPERPDFNNDTSQLDLIMAGKVERTESGRMLSAIKENQPAGQELYVVVELPHQAIDRLGYKDLAGPHREISAVVRNLVSN